MAFDSTDDAKAAIAIDRVLTALVYVDLLPDSAMPIFLEKLSTTGIEKKELELAKELFAEIRSENK